MTDVFPLPCVCLTWAYDPTTHGDWHSNSGHHPACPTNYVKVVTMEPKWYTLPSYEEEETD
jgi:hypothetical protein